MSAPTPYEKSLEHRIDKLEAFVEVILSNKQLSYTQLSQIWKDFKPGDKFAPIPRLF